MDGSSNQNTPATGIDGGDLDALIRRAQGRDEQALARLLELHTQRLLASVRAELGQRLRQRLESQDIMQEVFVDALEHIERFVNQGDDSFFAWLRRIALNRICDVDRRAFQAQKRAGEVRAADLGLEQSLLHLFDNVINPTSTPSRAADRSDHVRLLRAALEQLTDEQRQVIELRYLQQLNVAETAAKMNKTERAVRSLCVRALIHLRDKLGHAI